MSDAAFSIKVEPRELLSLIDLTDKNAPFAMAVALNRTAEDGLARLRENVRAGFTIREGHFMNLVAPQVLPSAYRARKDKLWATIEPKGAGQILAPFESGTPKRAESFGADSVNLTRQVAVPTMGVGGLRTTKRTKIPRALYPVNLGLVLRRDAKSSHLFYNTGRGARKRGAAGPPPIQGRYGTFVTPGKKPGVRVIWQRSEGHEKRPRPLWFLVDVVRRPANLGFYRGVQETVDTRWVPNMLGAFDMAIRTSK